MNSFFSFIDRFWLVVINHVYEFAPLCDVVVFEEVEHGECTLVVFDDRGCAGCADDGDDVVAQVAVFFSEGVYVCFRRLYGVMSFCRIDGIGGVSVGE